MKNQLGHHIEEEQDFEKITKEQTFALRAFKAPTKSKLQSPSVSVTIVDAPQLNTTSPIYGQFAEILAVASDVFKTAKIMIAGGAVRDTLLGRKVKDIDVFIEYPEYIHHAEIDRFAKMAGSKTPTKLSKCYYGQIVHLGDVFDTIWGKPVQLIFVKNLTHHFNSFTVNLSKVKYTAAGLTMSREFLNDVHNCQITNNAELMDEGMKEQYVARVAQKYPNFKVVKAADVAVVPTKDDLLQVVRSKAAEKLGTPIEVVSISRTFSILDF